MASCTRSKSCVVSRQRHPSPDQFAIAFLAPSQEIQQVDSVVCGHVTSNTRALGDMIVGQHQQAPDSVRNQSFAAKVAQHYALEGTF